MKWPAVSLEDVLSLEYGAALPAARRDSSGAIPVAGSNGVDGYHPEALVKGPAIVVGRKGSAGKVTWFDSDFWPIDTTFYVRPKMFLELRWVFYLLHPFRLDRLSIVTGVPGLNRNDAYNRKISLPPLSEQRRIVEILDQADALRTKRAEADAKAERILPALFTKMFGDPETNAMGWEKVALSDLAVELRYGTSMRCTSEPNGLPVLRIPNILRGEVDLSDLKYTELPPQEIDRLLLERGDLLFVRTNGNRDYVGRCAIFDLDAPYLFASYLIRIRVQLHKVDPWYIGTYLHTHCGRQAMSPYIRTTAGQSNISLEGLRQIPIPFPPLRMQRQFRAHIEHLYWLRQEREKRGNSLNTTFSCLLRRAFSGELTTTWREGHMKELLTEMKEQAKYFGALGPQGQRENAARQESLF